MMNREENIRNHSRMKGVGEYIVKLLPAREVIQSLLSLRLDWFPLHGYLVAQCMGY